MPTIELISIGAKSVPELPVTHHLKLLAEPSLQSHRTLFQTFLDETRGVIVHLGNLECEQADEWFANELVRWENSKALRFREDVLEEVKVLIQILLHSSPENLLLFLSDYDFGPETPSIHEAQSLASFLENHQLAKLEYNALYRITS